MMEMVRPWKLPPAVMICAWFSGTPLHLVRPLAGDLDRGLDRLGPGVHRKHHLGPGDLGQFATEQAELVVVERPGGQCHPLELLHGGGDQLGVPVAEIECRVAGEHVEVALTGDIGDPGALGLGNHHRQWVVVVRAPARRPDRGRSAGSSGRRVAGAGHVVLRVSADTVSGGRPSLRPPIPAYRATTCKGGFHGQEEGQRIRREEVAQEVR